MKHKKLTIAAIISVVIIAGGAAAFFLLGGPEKVKAILQPPTQEPQTVTVEGKVVCLPHKGDGPSTLECAVGLQSNEKYYGLSSSYDTELAEAAGTDKTVRISGKLEPGTSDKYQMDGVIAVSNLEFAE